MGYNYVCDWQTLNQSKNARFVILINCARVLIANHFPISPFLFRQLCSIHVRCFDDLRSVEISHYQIYYYLLLSTTARIRIPGVHVCVKNGDTCAAIYWRQTTTFNRNRGTHEHSIVSVSGEVIACTLFSIIDASWP